ncbi:hypothetical protein Q1695_015053 [Nippostrongylus brasiliensis]|nr:hypothetical protein Q1695_015053 [Nippostrongylus brasiliensis]
MRVLPTVFDAQFFVSIVAVIYYVYILVMMLTSRTSVFNAPFFRIFIATGFLDISCIMAIEWIRADLKCGFGPQFELISRISSIMTATNLFTHMFGCFLMVLNRYTAACHPHLYDKVQYSDLQLLLSPVNIASCFMLNLAPV